MFLMKVLNYLRILGLMCFNTIKVLIVASIDYSILFDIIYLC
jgi:hypothetical protein